MKRLKKMLISAVVVVMLFSVGFVLQASDNAYHHPEATVIQYTAFQEELIAANRRVVEAFTQMTFATPKEQGAAMRALKEKYVLPIFEARNAEYQHAGIDMASTVSMRVSISREWVNNTQHFIIPNPIAYSRMVNGELWSGHLHVDGSVTRIQWPLGSGNWTHSAVFTGLISPAGTTPFVECFEMAVYEVARHTLVEINFEEQFAKATQYVAEIFAQMNFTTLEEEKVALELLMNEHIGPIVQNYHEIMINAAEYVVSIYPHFSPMSTWAELHQTWHNNNLNFFPPATWFYGRFVNGLWMEGTLHLVNHSIVPSNVISGWWHHHAWYTGQLFPPAW
jgi:hypothetical protein